MNDIPLFKVYMDKNAANASKKVLNSGYITQGPVVEQFEKKLSKFFNEEKIVTTNSATSALHMIMHMLKTNGIGKDKVKLLIKETIF